MFLINCQQELPQPLQREALQGDLQHGYGWPPPTPNVVTQLEADYDQVLQSGSVVGGGVEPLLQGPSHVA